MARFTYHCALRWSDMDAFGHVNNARFLTLYEEARAALLFEVAREAGLSSMEQGMVIARQEIDYLRPIGYGTVSTGGTSSRQVRIETWTDDIRNASFAMAYELFDDDALAGRARSVLVPYDLREARPRRLNDQERAFLAAWRDEPGTSGC